MTDERAQRHAALAEKHARERRDLDIRHAYERRISGVYDEQELLDWEREHNITVNFESVPVTESSVYSNVVRSEAENYAMTSKKSDIAQDRIDHTGSFAEDGELGPKTAYTMADLAQSASIVDEAERNIRLAKGLGPRIEAEVEAEDQGWTTPHKDPSSWDAREPGGSENPFGRIG